jgi:hypothetical protein
MRDDRFDKRRDFGSFERLGTFNGFRFEKLGRFPGLGAARHPVAQFLSLLVIGAAVVGVVLMGAFILSFLIGAAMLAAAVLAARIWWFRRKLRSAAARAAASGSGASRGADAEREHVRDSRDRHGRLIDAEYTIVRERDAGRRGRERR